MGRVRILVPVLMLLCLPGCGNSSIRRAFDWLLGPVSPPARAGSGGGSAPESSGLASLDWIIASGFGLAFVFTIISFAASSIPIVGKIGAPALRSIAAAGLGSALASIVLKVLIVKYLNIAVAAIVVCAIVTAGLYLWGHRRWIRKQLQLKPGGRR